MLSGIQFKLWYPLYPTSLPGMNLLWDTTKQNFLEMSMWIRQGSWYNVVYLWRSLCHTQHSWWLPRESMMPSLCGIPWWKSSHVTRANREHLCYRSAVHIAISGFPNPTGWCQVISCVWGNIPLNYLMVEYFCSHIFSHHTNPQLYRACSGTILWTSK